ncbi:alpha/beta fold hydrolase [Acinetobacter sp. WZC-1]|uniref:alpha/beta fold hydrolase n=1 Tax=Acinetobacter sp. WZC-1 TaxID=3459034 RepID=UPI00403DB001
MLLNHEYKQVSDTNHRVPLVLIHGLFGSIGNLGMLARSFQQTHDIVQLDIRNHGRSPHSDEMSYPEMAVDIVETLDHLHIERFSVIGHSMGGKLAMQLTATATDRIEQVVVLDMAPFAYQENHHDWIFKALFAVREAKAETRQQATEIMRQILREDMVIQFLLKSFDKGQWRFNLDAIYQHYAEILSWENIPVWHKPVLFLRGGNSAYIKGPQRDAIHQQFSDAQLQTIEQAGHWLHAEQPAAVLQAIQQYLLVDRVQS